MAGEADRAASTDGPSIGSLKPRTICELTGTEEAPSSGLTEVSLGGIQSSTEKLQEKSSSESFVNTGRAWG
jgi:hypothetical protein